MSEKLNRTRSETWLGSIPIPQYPAPRPDSHQAQAWIDAEPNTILRGIKNRLYKGYETISFFDFYRSLLRVVTQFNQSPEVMDRYAVWWDIVPHKSKRWVYELIKSQLVRPPEIVDYSLHARDQFTDLIHRGIRTLVIFDDASYSANQLGEHLISPLSDAVRDNYLTGKMELVFCIPFVGSYAPQTIDRFPNSFHYGNTVNMSVKLLSDREMKPGSVVLGRTRDRIFRSVYDRRFSDTSHNAFFNHQQHLTVFDHKMADTTSLAWDVLTAIGIPFDQGIIRSPYQNPAFAYYSTESQDFASRYPTYPLEFLEGKKSM